MNRVAFATLGCKTNQYETDALMDLFYQNRYEITDYDDLADIYVINTCTVTHVGDKKSRQMIRRAKKNNPEAIVVVMGCYAQISPEEVKAIEGVDIVIGTDSRTHILEYIESYRKGDKKTPLVVVDDIMTVHNFENMVLNRVKVHTRAFIKIQEGCNQYCSYCIIPYARGHVRSRSMKHIIEEVETLSQKGYREFVLTGIHIGSYGVDLGEKRLIDLIEALNQLEHVSRIRLGSIEPRLITEAFIERLAPLEKVCDHFHLSLQSGSDSVLKRMNRRYSTDDYASAVSKLRKLYKNPAITTDLIAGFPGETENEHAETEAFIERIGFAEVHVFPFSKREGTPAATMPNQIPPNVKKSRADALSQIASKMRHNYLMQYNQTHLSVLIEEEKAGFYIGHTCNYLKVKITSESHLDAGRIVNVQIHLNADFELVGEIIS